MSVTLDDLLVSVPITESASFGELCDALRMIDKLPKERSEWGALFRVVELAESRKLVTVTRGADKRMASIILTDDGAAAARELKKEQLEESDEERELFKAIMDGHRMSRDDPRTPEQARYINFREDKKP
jgi:hypothetical protein